MNIQDVLTAKIKEAFQTLYGATLENVEFQATRKDFEGDITVVVFPMLRVKKMNPAQLGEELGQYLQEHGENWQKLRDAYATYLPYVSSRANLRLIFNDMLGELNTSHFGFRSSGKEEQTYHGTQTSETGIIFNTDNPFVIERIVSEGPTDIKSKDLRKGDKLVAVNGKRVDTKSNREQYFANPRFKSEISLTFSRNGKEFDVNVHSIAFWNLRSLLYDEWQDQNQAYVDKKSKNKIAYVHMNGG